MRIFISVYTITKDCEDFVRVAVVTDGLIVGFWILAFLTDGVREWMGFGNGWVDCGFLDFGFFNGWVDCGFLGLMLLEADGVTDGLIVGFLDFGFFNGWGNCGFLGLMLLEADGVTDGLIVGFLDFGFFNGWGNCGLCWGVVRLMGWEWMG
ncbi:MAG: hypothetical protein WBB43_23790 [Limnoraphis sp.]